MLLTRMAILGSSLLLAACGTFDEPASLTPGEWTGDVRAPEIPARRRHGCG